KELSQAVCQETAPRGAAAFGHPPAACGRQKTPAYIDRRFLRGDGRSGDRRPHADPGIAESCAYAARNICDSWGTAALARRAADIRPQAVAAEGDRPAVDEARGF